MCNKHNPKVKAFNFVFTLYGLLTSAIKYEFISDTVGWECCFKKKKNGVDVNATRFARECVTMHLRNMAESANFCPLH